jgi:hypothetical protein
MQPPFSSTAGHTQTPFVPEALSRIKGMFLEMPGTEWTVADAARLSGLDSSVCGAILDALRQAGFLVRRSDGAYVRCRTSRIGDGGPVDVQGVGSKAMRLAAPAADV